MNRKICYWKLSHSELQLGERTLLMGILNVTPDSFSDGGRFNDPDRAYARALELEEEGADIIDIGAESTRPGAHRISADEEWQRLVPVLKRLRDKLTVPLSLDTYKSEIAERALEYGIQIINDPSGLTFDPNLAKVAATGNAGLVLSHMRGTPETWAKLPPLPDVAGIIAQELEATVNRARRAGVEQNRIVVDPGLGFGKRKEQNSEILAHLHVFATLECPLLVGPSRKSFLAQSSDEDTLLATAAAVTASILGGAHIVRVHDVKAMRVVALISDEVARASRTLPKSEQEAVEREETKTRKRPRRTVDEERHVPPRPPISRPVAPVIVAPVAAAEGESVPQEMAASAAPPVPSETSNVERPKFDKPKFDKPKFEKPGFDRPKFDRPKFDRPRSERPSFDRPRAERPAGDRPRYERPAADRPKFDRPKFDRPKFDRPQFDRPRSDRPVSDRPASDRPKFDRPKFDRPKSDRPSFDRKGAPPRDGSRPPSRTFTSRPPGARPPFKRAGERPDSRPPGDRDRRSGPPRSDSDPRQGPADRLPRSAGASGAPRKPFDGKPPKRPFRKRP